MSEGLKARTVRRVAAGLAVGLAFAGAGLGSYLGDIQQSLERVATKDWAKTRLALDVAARARDNALHTARLLHADEAVARAALAAIDKNRATITAQLQEIDRLVYVPEGRALHGAMQQARSAYVRTSDKVAQLATQGDRLGAEGVYLTQALPALERLAGTVDDFIRLQALLVNGRPGRGARIATPGCPAPGTVRGMQLPGCIA